VSTIDPVVVVGAGVAGLSCALTLAEAGCPVRVLEAHPVPGGRVRSLMRDGRTVGELGPSWVWPRWQPCVAGWLSRLEVDTVAQHEHGDGLIERHRGLPPVRAVLPGQDGIRRVVGGPGALVDALMARLPSDSVTTGSPVTAIRTDGATLSVEIDGGERIAASAAIVACAPRIALQHIAFEPALPMALSKALQTAPTWMAAQAKAVAVYGTPFWRETGLSGRVASSVGPLVEIHDHCGPGGEPAALFGFVGVPAADRHAHGMRLHDAVLAQLGHCFGERALQPVALHIEDWSLDPRVCSAADRTGTPAHPQVLPPILREPSLDGRLRFCAAETAAVGPGLLEGAFAAGESVAKALLAARSIR